MSESTPGRSLGTLVAAARARVAADKLRNVQTSNGILLLASMDGTEENISVPDTTDQARDTSTQESPRHEDTPSTYESDRVFDRLRSEDVPRVDEMPIEVPPLGALWTQSYPIASGTSEITSPAKKVWDDQISQKTGRSSGRRANSRDQVPRFEEIVIFDPRTFKGTNVSYELDANLHLRLKYQVPSTGEKGRAPSEGETKP